MIVEALNIPRQTTWKTRRPRRLIGIGQRLPDGVAAAVVAGTSLLAWQASRQDHQQVRAEDDGCGDPPKLPSETG